MCRWPQGPLSCLFNTCANTLTASILVPFSLSYKDTDMCKRAAKTQRLPFDPCNLRNHIYLLKANLKW